MNSNMHRAASAQRKRVIAVASGGGHWQQLMVVAEALDACDVTYITTIKGLGADLPPGTVSIVRDCNRNSMFDCIVCAVSILAIFARRRPEVVITTGAMPGLIAVVIGKISRVRTIWIDSVANADELSMSGRLASRIATLCASQWSTVAEKSGVAYWGRVL